MDRLLEYDEIFLKNVCLYRYYRVWKHGRNCDYQNANTKDKWRGFGHAAAVTRNRQCFLMGFTK